MSAPDADIPAGRVVLAGEDAQLVGQFAVVARPLLALFCSIRCPGEVIPSAYDLVSALRDAGVAIVGGFHSPVEHECLRLLLRGTQPLVISPARSLAGMVVPPDWRAPLVAGRLALVAPFGATAHRTTGDAAIRRNAFVARLASRLLVLHASPGGHTEALCRTALAAGKPVYTLASEHNAHLLTLGARPITRQDASSLA